MLTTRTQILSARLWSIPRKFEHSSRQGSFLPHHLYPHPLETGKHALGDRARKLDQGILITRFELPFNIWWYGLSGTINIRPAHPRYNSGTCNNHIGMGVRYNAEKKKIGAYFSTPIFSFRCKCHLCDGWFEIQTDPKVSCALYMSESEAFGNM